MDSSGDPRAASPDLISSIFPLLPSNWGSPSCSFLVWIGHCGLSVYRRYKQHDLFTLSPKVNHFHPNTHFFPAHSSFILKQIFYTFLCPPVVWKKFFRKALIMGDWSFRRLGDIIDRSNFQSVPPCDKPVNSLANTHKIRTFTSEAFRKLTKECVPPITDTGSRIEIGLHPSYDVYVYCDQALNLRGFEQGWKGSFQNALYSWIQIWQRAV